MRRHPLLLCGLLALGGARGLPAPLGADPPPGPGAVDDVPGRVRAWVKDLASDSYEVRESARVALERWGREAPGVLREFEEDADPEIRRSVRGLLARLDKVVEAVPVGAADLGRVGLVRLEAHGEPLERVLDALGTSMAGRLRAPEGLGASPVSVVLSESPCFAALEALASSAGLLAPGPFDADGVLRLEAPREGEIPAPSGTSGPVRVRATRVEASRPLGTPGPATHGLTLEVQIAPCVQLVSYRAPRIAAALDAAGRRWRPAAGSDGSTTYGVGGEARRVEARVLLERADPEAGEQLARLDIVLDLRLRHERHSVTFGALEGLPRTLDLQGRPAEAGQRGSVTLESVTTAEGRPDAWTVEVACLLEGPTARASVETWLELADGSRRRLWFVGGRSSSSADGRLRLVGRVFGAGAGAPKAVHVAWFERESMGELPVTLRDVPLR